MTDGFGFSDDYRDIPSEADRIDTLERQVELLTTNLQTMQAAMLKIIQSMQQPDNRPVIVDVIGRRMN